jgi:chromosome segregation ATPase
MSEEWMTRIEKKIDGLGRRMDGLDGRMDQLDGRMDRLDGRIDQLDGRMDGVEVRLANLEQGQQKLGLDLEGRAADIRAIADGVIHLSERMDRGFADVMARLDDRAAPLEAASRYFATKLRDPEPRPKRPRRKGH